MTRVINIELKPNIAQIIMSHFERERDINNVSILKPNDPTAILKNQELKNILKNIQFYRESIFFNQEKSSLEKSREVLQLIKDELGESQ
tara:strand:- start:1398 stop:1664 length:267 start_codon:yes stop_codon:yes gene_type:complete